MHSCIIKCISDFDAFVTDWADLDQQLDKDPTLLDKYISSKEPLKQRKSHSRKVTVRTSVLPDGVGGLHFHFMQPCCCRRQRPLELLLILMVMKKLL